MKIGIGSYAYRWAIGCGNFTPRNPMSALDLLRRAIDLDVEVVQLCENIHLQQHNDRLLRELKQRAQQNGVIIEVGVQEVTLALQWLATQPHADSIVLGGSKIGQVQENLTAWEGMLDDSIREGGQIWTKNPRSSLSV